MKKQKGFTSLYTGEAQYLANHSAHCVANYNVSPQWFQHVNGVKVVIVRRIRSTPTTKPCHDRAHNWIGWFYRAGVL